MQAVEIAAPKHAVNTTQVLVASHLGKRFGDRIAVDDVSFEVAAGETYGLLGPNGAGKTTTIRLVCGLLRPDAGSAVIAGQQVSTTATVAKKYVGYVPQDIALYPDLTARENLQFFGRLYGLRGKALNHRVGKVLELVGLSERSRDRVESFSGGMKRRLNIGAGLLHEPTLLVLDEPTVGVDPQSRHAVMESVRSFGAAGMAVLYTTHYMEEAERLCDRVGIIDHGRLVAEGTRRELVAQLGEHDRIMLAATGDLGALADRCRGIDGIDRADVKDGQVQLLARDGRRVLPTVLDAAERSGTAIRSVEVAEPDLEAVFLHLTGTALRE
ncbi:MULTISPECIES: ABC transporter ATP-binding protein [unclassified Kribbella]